MMLFINLLVYGQTLINVKNLKDALICAVAAGTATTLMPGTALCQKDDFLQLIPKVKVHSM
jgi:fructose-1-phosphate kinase PfkB-like protein